MTTASSIGAVWPPAKEDTLYDKGNDRVKGFCTQSIEESSQLEKRIKELEIISQEKKATRIIARFIVKSEVAIPDNLKKNIEAIIPLDSRFEGYLLLYYGKNSEKRYADEEVIKRQRNAAVEIENATLFAGNSAIEIPRKEDVVLRIVKPSTDEREFRRFARSLLKLYKESYYGDYAFPMTTETVSSLIKKDTNIVVIVENEKDILSVGVGETIQIPIKFPEKRVILKMAEISDAATPEKYKGKGYYSLIASELMRELTKIGVDIVYGEARASSKAVQKVCAKSGRRIARDGLGRAAILHKHCIISGAKDEELDESNGNPKYARFENLSVWYATRERMLDLYATKK